MSATGSPSGGANRRTLIVGGGVSGLAAAFDLERAGFEAILIDRRPRLGGAIDTRHIDGCILETGADSFISQKPAALQLIADAGLESEVIGSNDHQRITFLKRGGKLLPMPEGLMMMVPTRVWPMARTGLLGWGAKVRMGLDYFRNAPPPGASAERTVERFILDHFPKEALDYLVEPLLSGVYGGDVALMSANAVLPRFVEMERKHGSLVRGALAGSTAPKSAGSLFRTLKGGLGSLVKRIAPRNAMLGREVESLEKLPDAGGWRARVNGDWIEAANVLLTGPAHGAAILAQPFAGRAAELLNGIGYSSSVTLTLGYRAPKLATPLRGFGFLVPRVERKRLLACTFVRNKFDHRVPEGWEAIRCFFGGASDEAALRESDESLERLAREELRELLGINAEPDFRVVSRWERAMAQYGIGHAARVEEIRAEIGKHAGLFLAGNAYQGIGIPDCIETGRAAARGILSADRRP